jgi:hypothetical protein
MEKPFFNGLNAEIFFKFHFDDSVQIFLFRPGNLAAREKDPLIFS